MIDAEGINLVGDNIKLVNERNNYLAMLRTIHATGALFFCPACLMIATGEDNEKQEIDHKESCFFMKLVDL